MTFGPTEPFWFLGGRARVLVPGDVEEWFTAARRVTARP